MRTATLCLPIKDGKILLGMKKIGFGKGKLNGFGGKVQENETIEQAAARELFEETSLKIDIEDLKKAGEIEFRFPEIKKEWNQTVHIFMIDKWKGNPEESDEMSCEWFDLDNIPFRRMWDTDQHWLPPILKGKRIKGTICFNDDTETTKSKEIIELGVIK